MSEQIELSKNDLLRLTECIDFEHQITDLDPNDIAEEAEVNAEGTE